LAGLCGSWSVLLGFGQDQAAIERHGFELDREALAVFVRPGSADASPDSLFVLAAVLDGVGEESGLVVAHDVFLSVLFGSARRGAFCAPMNTAGPRL
jgi:hypothetical protein